MRYLISLLLIVLLTTTFTFAKTNDDPINHRNLQVSEKLIDAFYSFHKATLEAALLTAQSSIPSVVFYQGWAEGGHYKIIKRLPCVAKKLNVVSCSITVQDDLMLALGIDFNVTDTFEISFSEAKIVLVKTSSNDLDVFWTAREWANKNHAELIDKPCQGIWNGGPTPGDCVRAMVAGYALFAASDDFQNSK